MSTFTIFLILILIVSVLLMLVIMVQNPKGGGLSSSLGGGSSQVHLVGPGNCWVILIQLRTTTNQLIIKLNDCSAIQRY